MSAASCSSFVLFLLAMIGATQPVAAADVVALIEQCGHARLAERETAFRELLERATPEDFTTIADALEGHRAGRTRTRCARVLGRLGTTGCREALERSLRKDASEHVRAAAAHALGDLGDRRAATALAEAARNDATTRVRRRAAVSFAQVSGATGYRTLTELKRDEPEWRVRRTIDWLLADRGRKLTRPARVRAGQTVEGSYEGTRYLVHVPSSYERTRPARVLAMIHGTDGQPAGYVDMARTFAEQHGLVVIAPWFDWPTFANFGMLNPGLDEVRADVRLLEIVAAVAERLPIDSDRLLMFGHSQGGAFVARFAVVHPDCVLRAVAGSANSFVDLESGDAFPWGVGPNPSLTHLRPFDAKTFARVPLFVVVGAAEERRFVEPARRFVEQTRALATRVEATATIRHYEIPNGKHAGDANFEAGRTFLAASD